MGGQYKKYVYRGPVMEFDKCICDIWEGETYAVSPGKAKSNLTYQFKVANNKIAGTRITLAGEIKEVINGR
jgi:ATP-dependent protease HslVU (ClpYQ) peptidase subunit